MGDEEETGSVDESSVEIMIAKVMTTSTVYTFADGTSVTETVDANGVKVLTTDSGQSITLGANVSQENMDTEVEPAPEVVSFTDAKGATFTDVTASEDLMEMKEDVSFTDAKGKVFTDVTASEDGMLMEEGTSFTDAKGATFTDEMITFEEDEEEMSPPSEDEEVTGPVETMIAKVMTTSTVYTFADGTSVTETIDANGMKVLTTDSGQSITLSANVSQKDMDSEVEPTPEVVSFTDTEGKVFTDITASEDEMEPDEKSKGPINGAGVEVQFKPTDPYNNPTSSLVYSPSHSPSINGAGVEVQFKSTDPEKNPTSSPSYSPSHSPSISKSPSYEPPSHTFKSTTPPVKTRKF